MKAGLYLRVSTEQQAQGTSLETQEAECRAEAVRLEYQVVDEAVVWEHYSGAYVGPARPLPAAGDSQVWSHRCGRGPRPRPPVQESP